MAADSLVCNACDLRLGRICRARRAASRTGTYARIGARAPGGSAGALVLRFGESDGVRAWRALHLFVALSRPIGLQQDPDRRCMGHWRGCRSAVLFDPGPLLPALQCLLIADV